MMKQGSYDYNIGGILKISSDIKGFVPDHFLSPDTNSVADVVIRRKKRLDVSCGAGFSKIAPGLFYNDDGMVISEFNILGIRISWGVKGLFGRTAEVFISDSYRKMVLMPVSTVQPSDDYVRFILQLRLLQKGYSFLLGGAIRPQGSDSAAIISSSGGMGKTTTVLELRRRLSADFFADDTVIISGARVYPFPENLRIRKFGTPVLSYNLSVPAQKVIPADKIARLNAAVSQVFFLERSDHNAVVPITPEAALNRALAINRKTLPYLTERSILAIFYSQDSPGMLAMEEMQKHILEGLFKTAASYIVTVKDPRAYTDLIAAEIERGKR